MISPQPYSCAVRRTRMKQAICFLFRPREQRDDRRSLKSAAPADEGSPDCTCGLIFPRSFLQSPRTGS